MIDVFLKIVAYGRANAVGILNNTKNMCYRRIRRSLTFVCEGRANAVGILNNPKNMCYRRIRRSLTLFSKNQLPHLGSEKTSQYSLVQ